MSGATRERFEKWAKDQGDSCTRIVCTCHDGRHERYYSAFTEWEWRAYSAATADMDELLGALRECAACLNECEFDDEGGILRRKIEALLARYGKLEGRGTK